MLVLILMHEKDVLKVLVTMSTVVTIKSVKVFENEEFANVALTMGQTVKGFKLNRDTNAIEDADVDTISFSRSALTRQLCDLNDDIALYRATRDRAFGQKEFGIILFGAKLTINRELKAAGEEVNGKALERDCYITTITGVALSERAVRQLDAACSL